MREDRDAILKALRKSKFKWRTSRSLAKDTGLPIQRVIDFLESSKDVIRSKKANAQGQALYAARESGNQTNEGNKGKSSETRDKHLRRLNCLLLLPLDASYHRVRDTLHNVLRENEVNPISLEDSFPPGASWVDQLSVVLRSSDFLIADVTRMNPNVFFELGIAHSLGKPFILLVSTASDSDKMPSDLAGYQYIYYEPDNLVPLSERVARFARHIVSQAERSL